MEAAINIISDLSRTDDRKRRRLLRWFAKESPLAQIEILDSTVANYHQLKSELPHLNRAQLHYLALIKVLTNRRDLERAPTRKASGHDFEPLRKITQIQAERIRALKRKKESPKRRKLVSLWGLVKQLHNDETLSFRDIAAFLKRHKKFKINYAYIQRVWKELEG